MIGIDMMSIPYKKRDIIIIIIQIFFLIPVKPYVKQGSNKKPVHSMARLRICDLPYSI